MPWRGRVGSSNFKILNLLYIHCRDDENEDEDHAMRKWGAQGVSMVGKCLFGPHLSIKIGFDLQGCRAAIASGMVPKNTRGAKNPSGV